jgi:predicted permease
MGWVRSVVERLRALLHRGRLDAEMDDELQFHLEMETKKNVDRGMPPDEARRRALIAFGGVERYREKTREERGTRPLEELARDLRFGVRTLRKAPTLVVVTILSLGLGIGASSTVFSLAKGLVLGDPGPLGDREDIVAVYPSEDDGGLYGETSFPDYLDIRSATTTLEALSAHRLGVLTLGDPELRERMIVELVSGEYFQVLGVTPILGRAFLPEESVPGQSDRLMVLSYRAWQERFGGDRGVLGQVLELDGQPYTVIGVAPRGLLARYMNIDVDGWVPLGVPGGIYRVSPRALQDPLSRQFFMLGRLAPGRTLEEAQAEMALLAERLQEEYPDRWADSRGRPRAITVVSEADSRVPPNVRIALLGTAALVLGGALVILLLACSNVASLLLARAHRRSWEVAVRVSLGAGRGRLFRMLLAESVLLALGGGALGLGLAHLATGYIRAIPLPMDVPLRFDSSLDGSALLFTLLLALGASLVAGVGPALRGSRADPSPALKRDSGLGGERGRRLTVRSLLVVGQVAAATFFVVGAGLALRSVQASGSYDVGLNPRNVAVSWEEPPEEDLPPAELRARFLDMAERIGAHAEVESVALARIAEAHLFMEDFATAEVEREEGDPLRIRFNAVTPGYFDMLEIPVARGRPIESTDVEGAPRVAVVNETFLERFFPGRDGVGERFRVSAWFDADRRQDQEGTTLEIVGVVPSPERPGGGRAGPFFWVSYLQDAPVRAILLAKGRAGTDAMVRILREESPPGLREFTPVEPGSYADYIEYRFLGNRIVSSVLSFAGLFALVLAFIGVFGIVSFAVNRRFREMAIRQAMGARREQVVGAILRRSLRGTGLGILLGLGLAVPLAYLARSALLGVEPLDIRAVGGGILLLVAASLVAGAIPARRLLRAEPMTVLREE